MISPIKKTAPSFCTFAVISINGIPANTAINPGIRIHKADGSVEKYRVYGFAESLTERVDEGIRLKFLTEPTVKVSEKWGKLPEMFSVIAIK